MSAVPALLGSYTPPRRGETQKELQIMRWVCLLLGLVFGIGAVYIFGEFPPNVETVHAMGLLLLLSYALMPVMFVLYGAVFAAVVSTRVVVVADAAANTQMHRTVKSTNNRLFAFMSACETVLGFLLVSGNCKEWNYLVCCSWVAFGVVLALGCSLVRTKTEVYYSDGT